MTVAEPKTNDVHDTRSDSGTYGTIHYEVLPAHGGGATSLLRVKLAPDATFHAVPGCMVACDGDVAMKGHIKRNVKALMLPSSDDARYTAFSNNGLTDANVLLAPSAYGQVFAVRVEDSMPVDGVEEGDGVSESTSESGNESDSESESTGESASESEREREVGCKGNEKSEPERVDESDVDCDEKGEGGAESNDESEGNGETDIERTGGGKWKGKWKGKGMGTGIGKRLGKGLSKGLSNGLSKGLSKRPSKGKRKPVGICVRDGALLATLGEVDVHTKRQTLLSLPKALLAGAGTSSKCVSGHGVAFVSAVGSVHDITLAAGARTQVSVAHLLTWEAGMRVEFRAAAAADGWLSSAVAGEGVVAVVDGPGVVRVQSRSPAQLAAFVYDSKAPPSRNLPLP